MTTAAEIFQAMRVADMGKVRELLDKHEEAAKKNPACAVFLNTLHVLFIKAKRKAP